MNKYVQAIIGMYQITPIRLLMSKSGLVSARMMLDYRQRKYTFQLLTLPDDYLSKNILSIMLKVGERNLLPEDLLEHDWI